MPLDTQSITKKSPESRHSPSAWKQPCNSSRKDEAGVKPDWAQTCKRSKNRLGVGSVAEKIACPKKEAEALTFYGKNPSGPIKPSNTHDFILHGEPKSPPGLRKRPP